MDEITLLNKVRGWLKKADSDLKNIKNNFNSEDIPTDTICFHAQQAIEKYIKGALIYFRKHVAKTHDLVNLLTSIIPNIPELKAFEEDLEEISDYGVEVRYPDLFYDPTLDEAKKSYNIALKVKEIILKKLEL